MAEEEPDPIEVANEYHDYFKGKLATESKVPVQEGRLGYDLSVWYSPGVAEPCKAIEADTEKVYNYTNKGNLIAVISDGTRVLGLGNIGPRAALPVMEGKAILYKYLGGVDTIALTLDTDDADKFINTVKTLQPALGGINLEDIEKPKCFEILDRCREELDIPVWHDDQQGTALVTLAGLYGALKVVGKKPEEIKLVVNGAGASGVNIAKYAIVGGVKPENIKLLDSTGILSPTRDDIKGTYKYEWAEKTNSEGMEGDLKKALDGADALVSVTIPGPGVIKPEEIEAMADDPIVFPMANPQPEILPSVAKEAGAKIVGTGLSNYPNQINNSLGFPSVFRGALDVYASEVTDEMCIAAAKAIADRAEEIGLSEDFVVPTMEDIEMYVKEAVAVGKKAMDQGVARIELSEEELEEKARKGITKPKEVMKTLMEKGHLESLPHRQ